MKMFNNRFVTVVLSVAFIALLPALGLAAAEAPKGPTLIELMTTSCPACAEMAKVLDQFTQKHGDTIAVQVVDAQKYPDVAGLYRVRYVPTLVFLDESGKVLDKRVGYMPLDALEKYWTELGYDLQNK